MIQVVFLCGRHDDLAELVILWPVALDLASPPK